MTTRISQIRTSVVYDEASRLLAEQSGTTTRDYLWLDDLPVGVVDSTGSVASISYVHADGLGTPRAITDATGTVQWQWPYAGNPFGEQAPVSLAGFTFNLRLPGQYYDAESGLNYNINRDYEPATGRYIQSDPIGLDGGMNTYGYVSQNPLGSIDPLGLKDYLDKCVGRYATCARWQNPAADGVVSSAWNAVKFKACKATVDFGVGGGDELSSNMTGTQIACDVEWKECISSYDTDPDRAPVCGIKREQCLMKGRSK